MRTPDPEAHLATGARSPLGSNDEGPVRTGGASGKPEHIGPYWADGL